MRARFTRHRCAVLVTVCRSFLLSWAVLVCAPPVVAGDANRVGVVSHVKVLSNRVEDVSSPEAWAASYIKPGEMTRIRCNTFWRARDNRDGYAVELAR